MEQDRLWAGKDSQVTDAELTRFGVVGSPEEAAEAIVRRVGDVQPSQVCFFANPPGMDLGMATESLRLFATQVRPLVDSRLRKSA